MNGKCASGSRLGSFHALRNYKSVPSIPPRLPCSRVYKSTKDGREQCQVDYREMKFQPCFTAMSILGFTLICNISTAATIIISKSHEQLNSTLFRKVTLPLHHMTMPHEVTDSVAPPSWLPLWGMLDFMTPNAQVYINAVSGIVNRVDLAKAETFNRASGYVTRFSSSEHYRNTTQWTKVEEFWTRGTIKYSILEQTSPNVKRKRDEERRAFPPANMSMAAARLLYRVFDSCGVDQIRRYYSSICAEGDGEQVCVTFSLSGLTCNVVKEILGHALEEGSLKAGAQGIESPAKDVCISSNPLDCSKNSLDI